jgi:hypothetical protein
MKSFTLLCLIFVTVFAMAHGGGSKYFSSEGDGFEGWTQITQRPPMQLNFDPDIFDDETKGKTKVVCQVVNDDDGET